MKKILGILLLGTILTIVFNSSELKAQIKSNPIDDQGPGKPPPKKDKN